MAVFVDQMPAMRRSEWALPAMLYGGFVLACILRLHPTAYDMASQWVSSSSYHHGALAAPLSLWMIAQRHPAAPSTNITAVFALLAAALCWLGGRAAGVALIEQLSLVGILIAGAGAIFGGPALRIWAFPLGFLFFMVPFGEVLTPALQAATANIVVTLLGAIGMLSATDGVLIRTPAGLFEIAAACAGLNFLLAALMIASLYAWMSLRGLARRLTYIALAAIVALAANVLRVFLIIWLATITDMRLAVGPDHLVIGFVFYGLVFAVLFVIGERFRQKKSPIAAHVHAERQPPWRMSVALLAFAPIIAAPAYAHFVMERPALSAAPQSLSPLNAPSWRAAPAPDNWAASLPHADRRVTASYFHEGDAVYTSLGYYSHDRRHAEIINIKNTPWNADYWRPIATQDAVVFLFGRSEKMRFDILAGPEGRRLAVVTAYWRGGDIYLKPRRFKYAQLLDKLKGVNPPGGVIMIAAAYEGEPEQAIRKIRAFTNDVEPFAVWRARNGGQN